MKPFTVIVTLLTPVMRIAAINHEHPFLEWWRLLDEHQDTVNSQTGHLYTLNHRHVAVRTLEVALNGIDQTVVSATGYSQQLPLEDTRWKFTLGSFDCLEKGTDARRIVTTSYIEDVVIPAHETCPLVLGYHIQGYDAHFHIGTQHHDYCVAVDQRLVN